MGMESGKIPDSALKSASEVMPTLLLQLNTNYVTPPNSRSYLLNLAPETQI